MQSNFSINPTEAERFLTALDEEAEVFVFQTFGDPPEKRGQMAMTLTGSLGDRSPRLAELNRRGAGIFVTVNEVAPGKPRRNDHIIRVRAVFSDFDGDVPPVTEAPIQPHIRVRSSPGKEHWYWLVEGLPLEDFPAIQQAIAARLGSDPKVKDLARVMRLPGFYHLKDPDNPQRVEIIEIEPFQPYGADAIREAFPPVEKPRAAMAVPGRKATDRYAQRAFDSAIAAVATAPEGARNDTLNREAHGLFGFVKAGRLDRDTVVAALENAARGVGLAEAEIKATLKSAWEAASPRHDGELEGRPSSSSDNPESTIEFEVIAHLSQSLGIEITEADLTDPRPEVLDKVRAELEARIDQAEKEAAQARRDWRALVQAQPFDQREWRILYRLAKRHLAGGAIRSADAKVMGLGKRELTDLIDRLAKSRQAFRRCRGIAARLKATTPEDDWQRRVSLARERQTEGKPPGPVGPDRPDAKHTASSSAEKKHPLDGKKVGCYRVISGRLYREVEKGDAVHTIAVANFAAHIVREVQRTDGLETRFLFEIEGWLGTGEPLPRALVTAKEFSGLNWICEHWGSRAMVYPGQAAKDHCRAAIQMMSDPERAVIYAHLGWTEIDSKPVFIHAGGGIGADGAVAGIEVDPGTALAGFVLPEPPTPNEVADLIRDVLDLPGTLTPDAIVWPLLLYVVGAPLGHSPFSLYLAGGSGARKTSLALVMQAFFGYRDAEPPISWEATANALERSAFDAKDLPLLVDDFAPTGDARAQEELRRKAARVLRSQGNKTGRLRMRADGTLAGDRPPRGSLIVTGEDLPPGHSVRARCLFIEVKPEDSKQGIAGDVNLHHLTEAQRMAREGHYARLMAAWIRWLAPRLTETQERLRERIESLRPQWASVHGRTTDAVARLQAVWELFAEFALEAGAVTQAEAQAYQDRLVAALQTVAEAQASIQKNADPAERFTELLQSLLSSGRAHLLDKNDETAPPDDPGKWGWRAIQGDSLATATPWQPQGRAIGWVDENNVYLDPQAAYAELDRLAGETGEPLPSSRTLWKRLSERGLLRTGIEKGKTRYTVKETCGGKRPRVAIFPVATLYVPESGASGAGGTNPHGSKAEGCPTNLDCPTPKWGTNPVPMPPDEAAPLTSGAQEKSGAASRPVTMRPRPDCPTCPTNPDTSPLRENPEKIFPPGFTDLVEAEAERLAGGDKPNGDGRDIGEI